MSKKKISQWKFKPFGKRKYLTHLAHVIHKFIQSNWWVALECSILRKAKANYNLDDKFLVKVQIN